jgi:hypothetical protein
MPRHQLNLLRRKAPKRLVFSNFDRFDFASLYRIAPGVLNDLVIVKPPCAGILSLIVARPDGTCNGLARWLLPLPYVVWKFMAHDRA